MDWYAFRAYFSVGQHTNRIMEKETEITEILQQLPGKVRAIARSGGERNSLLQKVCDLLRKEVPNYDWVGFYIVDPEKERELVLGPFTGAPTEHVRIPFGMGICGQAAESLQTFIVEDVATESNYLACSVDVKSEIVVPVMKGNTFVGELDIDSHTQSGVGDEDGKVLEELCKILAPLF